ncbi:MAG: hypothetical protein GQ565_11125 [Candidatus Aegiribacteria sp.]|nr:hypothetical protein [Candidatus Aegiribacteria sp.]
MVVKKETESDVSMSNTKKEILEAYGNLVRQLEEKAESELKPEKKLEEKKAVEVVSVADALAEESVLTRISDLKMEMSKTLTGISEKLEVETEKYKKIQEAITIKDNELKEIFEIERSAHALAALIEAQNQKKLEYETEISRKKAEYDDEMSTKKKLLEEEIQSTRALWDKEKQAIQESVKERDVEEKKLRQRQKEEFDYNFKREQELVKNKLTDEMEQLEKKMALQREAFEKSVEEKEKELQSRETRAAERETHMEDLEKKVAAFPEELETHIVKTVKETADRLNEEAKKNEAFLKKEAEGKVNVLQTKIDSLESVVKEQIRQLAGINARLEDAYGKVQDIAVKAIEGSSDKQTLTGIEQLVKNSRRQPQE